MKYLYFKMELNKYNKAEELKNKKKFLPELILYLVFSWERT